ncbi:cupin-like domain-containing protein [Sphingomonas sp. ZT3P38]|uniref:cupin-like domain-containing protein n=1 Tax=Parasphingomonas zepuensis TaxID=3096161 RepID=UPI002FC66C7D
MTAAARESMAYVAEVDVGVLGDARQFRREVMEPCRPVVLRGAYTHWPVVEAAGASPETLRTYLARFANDLKAQAFVGDPGIRGRYAYDDSPEGFNFERVEMGILEALDHILANAAGPGSPTVYLGSLETDLFLPGFAADNRTTAVPPGVSPRIWIGNASNVACHNDNFDNIACVVAGRRDFILYPPEAVTDLYIGPIDHTMSGRATSLAAGAMPRDKRFPRLGAAAEKALMARLLPGDALYIPKLWWHQVEATESFNVLVNYWWDGFRIGPDAPDTAMMLAMIAIAERPPAERLAWRAIFDHYVFRPHGHPLAHLPEAQHGILGSLQDGNYGRIRAFVMQLLRGR